MKINFPDDSNSTRNSTNLNHSKSKSSSRKKNKTPSASHENLNSQLHDKIIKNITETNVDIKRNGKFENVNLFLVFPIFFFSIVRKHQIQQRKKNYSNMIKGSKVSLKFIKKSKSALGKVWVKWVPKIKISDIKVFSEFSPFIYKNRFRRRFFHFIS